MFGELIGAWLAQAWLDQGAPAPFALAELGPGRGTLMADVLRATRAVPGFHAAAELWLVETSPALRAAQARALAPAEPRWSDTVADLPAGPAVPGRQRVLRRAADPAVPPRRPGLAASGGSGSHDGRLAFNFGPLRPDADLDARFPLAARRRAGRGRRRRRGHRRGIWARGSPPMAAPR